MTSIIAGLLIWNANEVFTGEVAHNSQVIREVKMKRKQSERGGDHIGLA
jgi:hypothetical protein